MSVVSLQDDLDRRKSLRPVGLALDSKFEPSVASVVRDDDDAAEGECVSTFAVSSYGSRHFLRTLLAFCDAASSAAPCRA